MSDLARTCGGAAFFTSFFTVPNDGKPPSLGSDAFDGGDGAFAAAFLTSFSPFLKTCAHGRGDADPTWLELIRRLSRRQEHQCESLQEGTSSLLGKARTCVALGAACLISFSAFLKKACTAGALGAGAAFMAVLAFKLAPRNSVRMANTMASNQIPRRSRLSLRLPYQISPAQDRVV